MTTMPRKRNTAKIILWVILGIVLLALLVIGILFLIHILRVTSSPAIEIISPAEGQPISALTPVLVQATALQRRAPVSRLDFYADGMLYGSISGEADSLVGSWNWTPASAGNHHLAFVAANTRGVLNLVRRSVEVTATADADADGIADASDACPDEYGYAASSGCVDEADTDGDGLNGDADACPEVFGSSIDGGCLPETRPDADGDGILDSADRCPEESGLAEFAGCPLEAWFSDRDGDSVPDTLDRCLDLAGSAETSGCPTAATGDGDGDGIADADDACPDEPGSAGSAGCPLAESDDGDGDGVADGADACPDEAGVGSADGCLPEDWGADADLDFIPDLFDRSPDLPGLFDLLGMPLPGDADSDGVPDGEDRCPDLVGSPEDGGCPRFELPEAAFALQNAFRVFPDLPIGSTPEPEGTVISAIEAAWPNDVDRDGVMDPREGIDEYLFDQCVGEDGEPYLNGCAPADDRDRDGFRDDYDRCDDVPGLYWGEFTGTYMLGCPREPEGEINIEIEITAVRTPNEMKEVYCYINPQAMVSEFNTIRIPPAYKNYSILPVAGYGYYLRLSEYETRQTWNNYRETHPVYLYVACWGQPDGISLPARYLGEIYRIVTVEDWDSQIRYAAGIGNDTMLEVFYRICRNNCP